MGGRRQSRKDRKEESKGRRNGEEERVGIKMVLKRSS